MSSCVLFIGLSQPPGVLYRFCTGQMSGVSVPIVPFEPLREARFG